MFKTIFRGFVYILGLCTLIGMLVSACTACTDEEAVEYVEPDKLEQVGVDEEVPEEYFEEEQQVEEEQEDFIFVEGPTCVPGEFSSYLVGVVKNNTNKDYDYIQITFTLYDVDGNVVGTALANAKNLKAGGTWKFEAMFFEDTASYWELDEIKGW